jgi:deazaflavin-dependent oxidoreductase (nitroreductase family)
MSVVSDLNFDPKDANAVQRVIQKIVSTGPASWLFQRTLYPIDKLLFRLTKGRVTVPGLLGGLPVIMLTTTGAKSGKDRTMPLLGIPMDGDVAIIGSNYGQESTPGWVYNLRASPKATVGHRAHSANVTARPANEAESERAFEVGAVFYPGFPKYRERASHREIEVFVLESDQA